MPLHRSFDVCIIGTGASGAICAAEIARRGLSVVLVEQGELAPRGALLSGSIPTGEAAYARRPDGSWTADGLAWTACVVGGGTRFYGGIAFRLRTVDFNAGSFTVTDALDPKWPFEYPVLRPYYDEIERMLPIARTPHLDPNEPAGPDPLMPAHPYSESGELLAKAGSSADCTPSRHRSRSTAPATAPDAPTSGRVAVTHARSGRKQTCSNGSWLPCSMTNSSP